jgi:hypothetical protein
MLIRARHLLAGLAIDFGPASCAYAWPDKPVVRHPE